MPSSTLIRTKLYRPPTTRDVVGRPELYERLEQGRGRSLTLISAPAGYGKTTLVSHWLESHPGPSAWISLDETENDPRMLVSYLAAAVRTIFPEACRETRVQLESQMSVPLADIAACLCNELDDCETDFVLVLDDYHRIHNPAVHDVLMGCLLEHRPRPLHLVVVSRTDPPLPLATLRAHDTMNEVRAKDLEFTERESGIFLRQATGRSISDSAVARVYGQVEGWAVGLRLTALALHHQQDPEVFLHGFPGDLQQVRKYLLDEVVSQQPPNVRDWMRRTSILDRLCAPLCEAIWMTDDPAAGREFIQFLEDQGMLCVPLDEKREWYRYHHLFQQLLSDQLQAQVAPSEVASLHRRAASWFEERGLLEEAIHHTLQGGGPAEAGRLIVRHRNQIVNGEQWHRLDAWLKRLPAEVIENNPELLMLEAWHCQNRGRYPQAYATLDRIDEMIESGACESCDIERLRGSVDALRSQQRCWLGQGELALEHIEQALERLPDDCLAERGFAILHKAGALQICGQREQGRQLIYHLMSDTSMPVGTYQGRLLLALCFLGWIGADFLGVRRAAAQCLEIGEKLGLDETASAGRYFLGIVHYQRNELSEAEAMLHPVALFKKVPNAEFLCETAFALASAHQAQGRAEKATEVVQSLSDFLLSLRNTDLLRRTEAFEAELAFQQGRIAKAQSWARGFDPEPFIAQSRFYEPRLTLAKVLIAQGSAESRTEADRLLDRLGTFFASIHNDRFLIETFAVQALLHHAQGSELAAREALGVALSIAQPGGLIRVFVDLGPELASLLNDLDLDEEGQRQVGRILAAFRADRESQAGRPLEHRAAQMNASEGPQPLRPPMTNRELDILGLLADRLSRQEIADRLHISTATVKRHAENIYSKLHVTGRRQAVAKARELAILSGPRAGTA
jgi:LuxR family maltose regulon positive regulatory protein